MDLPVDAEVPIGEFFGTNAQSVGRMKPYLLTISAKGNPWRRQIADLMVARAPELGEWRFDSSRPARPAPSAAQLPESGARFETSAGDFVSMERPERGRLDLVVVAASPERAFKNRPCNDGSRRRQKWTTKPSEARVQLAVWPELRRPT